MRIRLCQMLWWTKSVSGVQEACWLPRLTRCALVPEAVRTECRALRREVLARASVRCMCRLHSGGVSQLPVCRRPRRSETEPARR